jgi:hypothetical protein
MRFDIDSYPILVDNGASHSFTNCKADYVAPPKPFHRRIHGLKTGHASHIGTVGWSWADDDGQIVTEIIPNVLLCKDLPYRMLSPQQWAQSQQDFKPLRNGMRCVTDADTVVLEWDEQTRRRTIPLIPGAQNVGLMHSAVVKPRRFTVFCALLDGTGTLPIATELPHCFHSHVIPPDDEEAASTASEGAIHESSAAPSAPTASEGEPLGATPIPTVGASSTRTSTANGDSHGDTHASTSAATAEAPRTTPILVEFGLNDLPNDEADDSVELDKPQDELMRQHIRLVHLPFFKLKALAEIGALPRKIIHCRPPKCAACMYAKATKRPWRYSSTEGPQPVQPRMATAPGECISIDLLESSTPGLIAQLKGTPTKARYMCATVFVDHYSRWSYVHFQKSTSGAETVEAKRAFERLAASHNVRIRHYHADNGRFAENLFMQEIIPCGQTISFCGVNAHFQNGIAERRIRELQDQARTNLVFAQHRWPTAISSNLWPYAVRHVNEVFNSTPHLAQEQSPTAKFTGTIEEPKTKHFHHFGCLSISLTQACNKVERALSSCRERALVCTSAHPRSI